jgi:hypothetical protein
MSKDAKFIAFIKTASREKIATLVVRLMEENDDHALDEIIEGLNRII